MMLRPRTFTPRFPRAEPRNALIDVFTAGADDETGAFAFWRATAQRTRDRAALLRRRRRTMAPAGAGAWTRLRARRTRALRLRQRRPLDGPAGVHACGRSQAHDRADR